MTSWIIAIIVTRNHPAKNCESPTPFRLYIDNNPRQCKSILDYRPYLFSYPTYDLQVEIRGVRDNAYSEISNHHPNIRRCIVRGCS